MKSAFILLALQSKLSLGVYDKAYKVQVMPANPESCARKVQVTVSRSTQEREFSPKGTLLLSAPL